MTLFNLGTTDDDGTGTPLVRAGELLEALLGGVISRTDDVGAATADRGNAYIVPASATGDWSGQDDGIAIYDGSAWQFYTPAEGTETFVQDDDERVRFDGTNWGAVGSPATATAAPTFSGFYAYRDGSNQSISGATSTTLVLDLEVYDTEGGYDPTTGIYTVPASIGGKYMMFSSGWLSDGFTGEDGAMEIVHNDGSATTIARIHDADTNAQQLTSPAVRVNTGDTIRAVIRTSNSSTVNASPRSFFSGHVIEPALASLPVAFKGFRASRQSSAQSLSSATANVLIFNSENVDTEGAYDDTTGIFTVPGSLAGKYMVLSAGAQLSSEETTSFNIQQDTGGGFGQIVNVQINASSSYNVTSPPILMVEGHQFRVVANPGGATDMSVGDKSFFSGYVVETSEDAFDYILDTNTSRTLGAADFKGNRTIKMENASAITVTLNSGIVANGPLTIIQGGAGTVSISAGAGVTINSKGSLTDINGEMAAATLIPTETADEYDLIGDLA